MLMQQLTFPGMRAVWSGSGVIWPAALSGFTESHCVISALSLAQRNHYIPKAQHVLKAHNATEEQRSP